MKSDKKIKALTKYMMEETQLELPSSNFVHNVMEAIQAENEQVAIKNVTPLISKTAWVLIFLSIAVICLFVVSHPHSSSSLLSQIDVSFLDKIQIPSLTLFNQIHVSETLAYSMVLFAGFVIIQMIVIKNIINKQYSN